MQHVSNSVSKFQHVPKKVGHLFSISVSLSMSCQYVSKLVIQFQHVSQRAFQYASHSASQQVFSLSAGQSVSFDEVINPVSHFQ